MCLAYGMTGYELLRQERGRIALVAKGLGINPGAVSQWKEIPPTRVPAVSKITGIPRHELRPDLHEGPEAGA